MRNTRRAVKLKDQDSQNQPESFDVKKQKYDPVVKLTRIVPSPLKEINIVPLNDDQEGNCDADSNDEDGDFEADSDEDRLWIDDEKGTKAESEENETESEDEEEAKSTAGGWDCPVPVCNAEFTDSKSLRGHLKEHYLEESPECPLCQEAYPRASQLHAHILTHHMQKKIRVSNYDPKPKECPVCGKWVTNLGYHQRIHSPSRYKWPCPECDKRFYSSEDLQRHQVSHIGARTYSCPDCHKRYAQESSLQKHLRTHKTTGAVNGDFIKVGGAIRCLLCSKKITFKTFEEFKGHLFDKHFKIKDQSRISCKLCKSKNSTRTGTLDLIDHLFECHMDLEIGCGICGLSLSTPSDVGQHLYAKHRFDRKICPICGQWVRNLSTHKKRHNPQVPCEECDLKFINQYELGVHIRAQHKKEKLLSCQFCTKSFSRMADYNKHQVVHTGERRFPCPMCEKRFTQSGNLKKHVTFVHRDK